MSFDRADYVDFQIATRDDHAASFQRSVVDASQAVPPMESLTGDAGWDLYLSLIQAKIEKAQAHLEALQKEMLEQSTMGYEEMVQAKTRQLLVRQAIETYQECRDIPKVLLDQGREAKKLLREHDVAS